MAARADRPRGRPRRRALRRPRGARPRHRPAGPVDGLRRRPDPDRHGALVRRPLRVLQTRASDRARARMTGSEKQPPLSDDTTSATAAPPQAGDVVPLREATKIWFAISLQTFGGPAGQIAVMQNTLVDEQRWIGQKRFLHALSYCTLLPGPEAQQLAIYIGWLLNGVRGGLVAGILFVLPGVVALLGLSALYVGAGDTTVVTAVLAAVAPAVLAIVAQAVVRVGGRALGHPALVALAVAAFVALSVFAVPFPLVIAVAAAIGWALGRWAPQTMTTKEGPGGGDDGPPPLIRDDALHTERPSRLHSLKVVVVGLLAWAIPVGAV